MSANTAKLHARIVRVRALIEHPATPADERAVAEVALAKLEARHRAATRRDGAKYVATEGLTLAQVAKLIRAEIRHARTATLDTGAAPAEPGALMPADPLRAIPTSVKISVRIKTYSGGQSIAICVANVPVDWGFVPTAEPDRFRRYDRAPVLRSLVDGLAALLEDYNYLAAWDEVRYYGSVEVEHPEDVNPPVVSGPRPRRRLAANR